MQLLLVATVALSATLVAGYGNRPFVADSPQLTTACKQLYPDHGGLALQSGTNPYSLDTVKQGDGNVKVTISGSGSSKFVGFILQSSGASGTFIDIGEAIHVPCIEGPTIRHANSANETSYTATWKPQSGGGSVTIKGSAVREWTVFYRLTSTVSL